MIFTAFHLSYRKFKQTQGEYASGSLGFMLRVMRFNLTCGSVRRDSQQQPQQVVQIVSYF